MRRFALLAALLVAAAGCDKSTSFDRSGCQGFPKQLRVLPDTTLGQRDSLTQELKGRQPFFQHTAEKDFVLTTFVDKRRVAYSTIDLDTNSAVLKVFPIEPGSTKVSVAAQDNCQKNSSFRFNVRVVDSNSD